MFLLVTHITSSHAFTSSVGLILDYWKLRRAASVEKCGLNSNACVVADLTSIDLECYQLFACFTICVGVCVCVSVHV